MFSDWDNFKHKEMKLQLVDYQTAKDLKELGFDWPCYMSCFELENMTNSNMEFDSNFRVNHNENKWLYNRCSLPETALVVKWFRYVHKISIETYTDVTNYVCYTIKSCFNTSGNYIQILKDSIQYDEMFETHDIAELNGIRFTIQHLKGEK